MNNIYIICDKPSSEAAHVKFCKFTLGVHRKATNSAVRGELGSYPLLIDMVCNSNKYWTHLHNVNQNSIVYKSI